MVYIKSPMENYNKSNPFVIMARTKYYEIIDLIQETCSQWICRSIIDGVILVVFSILGVIFTHITHEPLTYIVIWIIVFISLYILECIYKYYTMNKFLVNNETMQNYDKLANLEVSEILSINNEQMMMCINELFELSGSLKTTKNFVDNRDYFRVSLYVLSWVFLIIE